MVQRENKKKRGCLFAFLSVIVVVVVMIVMLFLFVMKNMKSYNDMDYTKLDLKKVEDGTYTGFEDGGMVKVKVNVTVANHIITNIDILEHDNGRGEPAENIIDDIVKQNSVDVDGVSGATLSSNVIKTAVYNALTNNN